MAVPAGIMASLIGGWFGSKGQSSANRTNIKLQREQQAWEQMMSNTAVQRRAWDIERAGGNRALAFTGGQEATTPSVQPARVENENVAASDALMNLGPRLLMAAQFKNVQAQTRLTNAEARLREERVKYGIGEAGTEALNWTIKFRESGLLSEKIDKARADAEISKMTAEILKAKGPQIIKLLTAQADMEKLTFESAKAMADFLGVKTNDATAVAKMLMQIFLSFKH